MRQQTRAVVVAPLQIVDKHHQRMHVGDPPEHLAEGGEGPRAQLPGIVGGCAASPLSPQDVDPLKHRKQPRQRFEIARQDPDRLHVGQIAQKARQRIDDVVKRFERDRLPLIAASREHHRAIPLRHICDEVPHQGSLSDSGGTFHQRDHWLVLFGGGECVIQGRKLPFAPDKAAGLTGDFWDCDPGLATQARQ